jgi:hypothetical protein
MIFSLDIFDLKLTILETVVGLFVHNLPALFLLVILIISWKYEIIGGIIFNLIGLAYILILVINFGFKWDMLSWSLIISAPAFLIGILFIINWFKKRKI